MELLIVSGMSGAGKTCALQALEDIGYYCVDNLPPQLLLYFLNSEVEAGLLREKMAVTVDIRCESLLGGLEDMRKGLVDRNIRTRILFLDTDDEQLRRRYKETRRLHPLILKRKALDLPEALAMERKMLTPIRQMADVVLDTTKLTTAKTRKRLIDLFAPRDYQGMTIEFVAFGYKYGILADADLVFDLRCLPNPFYEPALRDLTGNDPEVRAFVLGTDEGKEMLAKIRDYLEFSLPLYIREGKSRLVIGLGCTGGQHRSLAFAGLLKEHFEKNYNGTKLISRDMEENRFELVGRMSAPIVGTDGQNEE